MRLKSQLQIFCHQLQGHPFKDAPKPLQRTAKGAHKQRPRKHPASAIANLPTSALSSLSLPFSINLSQIMPPKVTLLSKKLSLNVVKSKVVAPANRGKMMEWNDVFSSSSRCVYVVENHRHLDHPNAFPRSMCKCNAPPSIKHSSKLPNQTPRYDNHHSRP